MPSQHVFQSTTYIDANGQETQYPLNIKNSYDVFQEQLKTLFIDLRGQEIVLDGLTYLNATIAPLDQTTVKMFMYYNKIEKSTPLDMINKLTAIE